MIAISLKHPSNNS